MPDLNTMKSCCWNTKDAYLYKFDYVCCWPTIKTSVKLLNAMNIWIYACIDVWYLYIVYMPICSMQADPLLTIYLSIYVSIYHIYLYIYLSIFLSISIFSIYLSINMLMFCLSSRIQTSVAVCLSCISACLSFCLSFYLSFYLTFCLSFCNECLTRKNCLETCINPGTTLQLLMSARTSEYIYYGTWYCIYYRWSVKKIGVEL